VLPVIFLTSFLLTEVLVFSLWLDTGGLRPDSPIRQFGPITVRVAVVFGVLMALFGGKVLRRVRLCLDPIWLVAHGSCVGLFAVLSENVFHGSGTESLLPAWLAAGLALLLSALLAFVRMSDGFAALRDLRGLIAVVLPVSVLAATASRLVWGMWDIGGGLTFRIVEVLLRPFVPGLRADFASRTLASRSFEIEIAPQCSGYEGIGLILLFGAFWLWINRSEYRFPRALLLLPVGAAMIFVLNSGRIATLFLIGYWGAEGIALGGFHSQAGWIAFLAVSISFAAWSRRLTWISAAGPGISGPPPAVSADPEPTAVALAPFLAITAASILTAALSAGFDWLYPARLVAAAAAIWLWRREYARLDWSLSWPPVLSGTVVIAVWIAHEWLTGAGPKPPADWPPLWWIAIRTVAACITVPIAEELAFRHFLQRRFASADFTLVDPRRVPWLPVLAASVLFGVLHGSRWPAGVFAGLVFGFEYRRRGSIGDAVLSHAVANALLAAYVLSTGNWQLW
jgi:exosortase E/protease (VPEID-CTERM system)